MDAAERALPKYVVRERERDLDCGVLARGFARVVCGQCGCTRLVGFSCKSRSFCPSCLGRVMNETAAHLCDHVLGDVPVRHWVLSLPPPLRYLVAHDVSLSGAVLDAFIRSVFGWLRHQAKRELGLGSARDLRYKLLRPFKKALAKSTPAGELDRLIESVPGVGLRLNVSGQALVVEAPSCAA